MRDFWVRAATGCFFLGGVIFLQAEVSSSGGQASYGQEESTSTGQITVADIKLCPGGLEVSLLSTLEGVSAWDLYCSEPGPASSVHGSSPAWQLVASDFILTNGTSTTWTDTTLGSAPRFYVLGSASDSDGDSLKSGMEVFIYKTDPADEDSDDDGFHDGYEIQLVTDPLNPDTESPAVTIVWPESPCLWIP